MTKRLKIKLFIVLAFVLAALASVTCVSVSYAKWTGTNPIEVGANGTTGSWKVYDYAVVTEDGTAFPLIGQSGTYVGTFYAGNTERETGFTVYYNSRPVSHGLSADSNAEKLLQDYRTLKGKGLYSVKVTGSALSVKYLFGGSFSELITSQDSQSKEIMKDILRESGCVDENGKVQGAITSTGQVVQFNTPVTLQKGEQLVIFAAGEQAYGGMQINNGHYGISQGQSDNVTIGRDNVITANAEGAYEVKIVKGNLSGDDGIANLYNWIAIQGV